MSFLHRLHAAGQPLSFIKKLKKLAELELSFDAPDIDEEISEIDLDDSSEMPTENVAVFIADLEKKLKMQQGKLVLYRAMNIDEKSNAFLERVSSKPSEVEEKYGIDLEERGVGTSWTYDRRKAIPYWGRSGKTYILKALVAPKYVDEYTTLALAERLGDGEAEIRLVENAPLLLVSIESKSKKKTVNLKIVASEKRSQRR